jgi:hypothetical protein
VRPPSLPFVKGAVIGGGEDNALGGAVFLRYTVCVRKERTWTRYSLHAWMNRLSVKLGL